MRKCGDFSMPDSTKNEKGQTRKVGFEVEFTGVPLRDAAETVAEIFGGFVREESPFDFRVEESPYGDFVVELDAAILKDRRYKEHLGKIGVDIDQLDIGDDVEQILSRLAGAVVPHEIVLPPIPMDEIEIVDRLRDRLRRCDAKGTKTSPLYAFGLQINTEVPSEKPDVLACFLKSFFLLYPWIFKISEIDLTRRIFPYINDFPEEYVQRVLGPFYRPGAVDLVEDYLEFNPTRNRPLDMLPLFRFMDEPRVLSRAEEVELIKARPAFHYRLPNCSIDDPAWSVAREWNLWVEVEQLAAHPGKIDRMARDYLDTIKPPYVFGRSKWVRKVPEWIGR